MRRACISLAFVVVAAGCQPAAPARVCAIDMGSNSFRRIVGMFAEGNYTEFRIDSVTIGVGDDVERNHHISEAKLGQISEQLSAFAAACEKDGALNPVAVGTAAFRDAPNGVEAVARAALA